MSIILIGISHKTAPVGLREQLAFNESSIPEALAELVDHQTLDEAIIISTCNRVEIIASTPASTQEGFERLLKFLCQHHKIQPESLDGHLYRRADAEAIRHIFRVAASLDSMVVGESQILGQVKEAYRLAAEAGAVGRVLGQLMDRAISVAKRIRSQTAIALKPVSISSVAVDLAGQIFGQLTNKIVLLIGAGEMAEAAARHLAQAGASKLIVTNRTLERAQQIAQTYGGQAAHIDQIYDLLKTCDIVICSAAAEQYLIVCDQAARALRARRRGPILFIDISVPRNVDPAIASLDDAFLFDIDDLKSVAEQNLRERRREALAAEQIIDREVECFLHHLNSLDMGPTIAEIKRMIHEMALRELKRNKRHLGALNQEQEAAIRDVLIPALVNKLSHPIIAHLKAASRQGQHKSALEELRKALHLD
jgi:glutamyl-tRNA reductase